MEDPENIVCVQINNQDIYFEVFDEEERRKILTDSAYALQLYNNNYSTNNSFTFLENDAYLQTKSEASQVLSQDSDDFLWNDKNTLLLLEEYRNRKEKFRNPKIKKRTLWQEIVSVFFKHNYSVNEDIVDKKFRNIKQTFMRIRDNQNTKKRTGKGNITWKFYDILCEIFSIDKTVNMEIQSIESPILPQTNSSNTPEPVGQAYNYSTPKSTKMNSSVLANSMSSSIIMPHNRSILNKIQVDDKSIEDRDGVMQNTNPTAKKPRKGLLQYRQELLKIEKQRVSEISDLKKSLDENNTLFKEMVEIAKERNKILAKLVDGKQK